MNDQGGKFLSVMCALGIVFVLFGIIWWDQIAAVNLSFLSIIIIISGALMTIVSFVLLIKHSK